MRARKPAIDRPLQPVVVRDSRWFVHGRAQLVRRFGPLVADVVPTNLSEPPERPVSHPGSMTRRLDQRHAHERYLDVALGAVSVELLPRLRLAGAEGCRRGPESLFRIAMCIYQRPQVSEHVIE